jgi:hypothetical protein
MTYYIREIFYQEIRECIAGPLALVCPSGLGRDVDDGTRWNPELDADGELPYCPDNSSWYAGRKIHYQLLHRMTGLPSYADPYPSVPTSPLRLTDEGSKHLAADLNHSRQDAPSTNSTYARQYMSHAVQVGPTLIPEGGNRLYLSGSVEWVGRERLGRNDTPLEPTSSWLWAGSEWYDHWTPGDRKYFW